MTSAKVGVLFDTLTSSFTIAMWNTSESALTALHNHASLLGVVLMSKKIERSAQILEL